MNNQLHFMCGKMASGKSTLAKELAVKYDAILFCEDDILKTLYPNEINTISKYVMYSKRLKVMLKGHIVEMLKQGNNIVLDFPANTKEQRRWFRGVFEEAWVKHTLHLIDKDDDICKRQLSYRSKDLPKGLPFTTEKEFNMITAYFEEPHESEKFNIARYC